MRAALLLIPSQVVRGLGERASLLHLHHMADEGQGKLVYIQLTGLALLCYLGVVQGLHGVEPALHSPWTSSCSQVASQIRDVCMSFGGNMSHGHCCCMTTVPDLTLRDSMGQDFIMASCARPGHSHQAVPLYQEIRYLQLHLCIVYKLFLLVFSFIFPPHTCTL